MNTNTILVIAAIGLAAVAALSIKGCIDKGRPAPPISVIQPARDSVKVITEQTKREVDSLKREMSGIYMQRDSLVWVNIKQSDEINVKNIKINALSKEYSLYRKYKDTAQALNTCDSISDKVNDLTASIEELQHTNRALQNSNDSLLGATSLALAKTEYENSVLKEKFNSVALITDQLEKDNAKLKKKANKRFGFGPSGGATYLNGKISPYGGLGFHYDIFKL